LEEQRKIINGFKQELSEIKSKLDIIYENYQSIREILECARNIREKEGWSAVKKCNVQKYNPREGVIYIRVGDTELPLSIRHTLESQILEFEKEKGELEKK
jgi:hypothetical protein